MEPLSVPCPLWACLCVSLSPSPLSQENSLSQLGTHPNTCHPSPLPPAPAPPPGSCPEGPYHSPSGATHPQQHSASHQANGTLPILGAPRDLCQTFLRSCWAHGGGGGRAGRSRPSPQLRAPRLWHCLPGTGRAPCRLHSVAAFPAPGPPPLPPGPRQLFPRPWRPPASTLRAGSPGGPPGLRGVNSERRGPALS